MQGNSMEQYGPSGDIQPSSEVTIPGSIYRLFKHHRTLPELPKKYDWDKQKQHYSPPNLFTNRHPWRFRLEHKFGYVFCHRGFYERSKRILDNSNAAIQNGIKENLFLHEVDGFVFEKLDHSFVAHDQVGWRVSQKEQKWKSYSYRDVLRTSLISRSINPEMIDFASSYLLAQGKVPSLLGTLWNDRVQPAGATIQIDLRDEDFAKAFPYYSFHMSKLKHQSNYHRGADQTLVADLFRPTMFKGYNKFYESFDDLHKAISKESMDVYGEDYFELRHLPLFPPLIMVFSLKYLEKLAAKKTPVNSEWPRESYEHIHHTVMKQISSFIGIGETKYNFILEVGFSGLGLGYDKIKQEAYNPLNGELLTDKGVIFEALVDRAMIDVSLELQRENKDLLLSSCTRLPDVITSRGRYKAGHEFGRMVLWESDKKEKAPGQPLSEQELAIQKEKGLSSELRAIHGGLYPQSHIVVADNPTAEIAARTWIDQYAKLDRKQLLRAPGANNDEWTHYEKWLSQAGSNVRNAMQRINGEFLPNKFGVEVEDPDSISGQHGRMSADTENKVQAWLHAQGSPPSTELGSNPEDNNMRREIGPGSDIQDVDIRSTAQETSGQDYEQRQRRQSSSQTDENADEQGIALNDAGQTHVFEIGHLEPGAIVDVQGMKFKFQSVADANRARATTKAYLAAWHGLEKPLRNALDSGADVNAFTGLHGTPLAAACARGDSMTVRILLENGADINVKGAFGHPLGIASKNGHGNVIGMMVKTGAYAKISDEVVNGALQSACAGRHHHLVRYLLANGADANFPGGEYGTALQAACAKGHIRIINTLLDKNARIDDTSRRHSTTALAEASSNGYLDVVKLLVSRKARLDCPEDGGKSALYLACMHGHEQIARFLIDQGADVNTVDNIGNSALYWACMKRLLPVAQLLLRNGAQINFPCNERWFGPEINSLLREFGAVMENREQASYEPTTEPETISSLAQERADIDRIRGLDLRRPFLEKPLGSSKIRIRKISYEKHRTIKKPSREPDESIVVRPPQLRTCGCLVCYIDQRAQPLMPTWRSDAVHASDPVSYSLEQRRLWEQRVMAQYSQGRKPQDDDDDDDSYTRRPQ